MEDFGIQGFRDQGIKGLRDLGIQEFRDLGIQGAGELVFVICDFQGLWIYGLVIQGLKDLVEGIL